MDGKDVYKNILWGAATASYQVEGATRSGGKGETSWDKFYKINNFGYNGDIAVDHYNRIEDDIKLFKEIGLQTYRFSISWARIFPNEMGSVNMEGLKFYDKIVDTLIQYGIEPYMTMYHWDLPIYLLEKGGWLNRKIVEDYVEYCELLFKHFRGRVKLFATINEPASEVIEGYIQGTHPPQQKNYKNAFIVSHHYNLASAYAIKKFRELDMEGKIGIVLNPMPVDIIEETDKNKKAQKIAYDYLSDWYISPALTGKYPEEMLKYCTQTYGFPMISKEDYNVLQENIGDYLGINYYMRRVVKANNLHSEKIEEKYSFVKVEDGKYTKWGWEIYPKGLKQLIDKIYKKYGKIDIIIAENGIGFDDKIYKNKIFYDDARIDYLNMHIKSVINLYKSGVNILGYYVWSAIDLLSWTNGYQKRYGLIGVDFDTMERSIKLSASWYNYFIKTGKILELKEIINKDEFVSRCDIKKVINISNDK